MISKEDIKNLAELSRIEMTDAEIEAVRPEIDSILGYVGQIQSASANESKSEERKAPSLRNVMRDDKVTHEAGEYTEKLLKNAPEREGNYLKVKNIL